MNYAIFQRAIGPALIYKTEASFLTPWVKDQWHWKYHDGASIYGPFATQEGCEIHAKACLIASGRDSDDFKNVVYVDFIGKQFLRDGNYTRTKKTLNKLKGRYNPGGIL